MRNVRQRGLRPERQRKVVGLHAVLLACFGLCGSIQAVERHTVGGTIIVYRGAQTEKVDFAPKTAPSGPIHVLPGTHHRPEIGPNVLRLSEESADIGLPAGSMHRTDPPPVLEPTVAVAEPAAATATDSSAEPGAEPAKADNKPSVPEVPSPQAPQPAAPTTILVWPPGVQQAFDHHRPGSLTAPAPQPAAPSNNYSTLEIVSLSVGISFALSLVAIWLVVIAVQRLLQHASTAPRNEPVRHDTRQDLSAAAYQNTATAIEPDRHQAAAQRPTRIVDLAHDPVALAPVAADHQRQRRAEQKRRKDQQMAILESVYQENLALQQITGQLTTVQAAPS